MEQRQSGREAGLGLDVLEICSGQRVRHAGRSADAHPKTEGNKC